MIELSVILGVYAPLSLLLIAYLVRSAREERKELEDRVMALSSKPDAIITHKALRDPEPAEISYVDEAREYALAHGGNYETLDEDEN